MTFASAQSPERVLLHLSKRCCVYHVATFTYYPLTRPTVLKLFHIPACGHVRRKLVAFAHRHENGTVNVLTEPLKFALTPKYPEAAGPRTRVRDV